MKHPHARNLLVLGVFLLLATPVRAQSQDPAAGSGSFSSAAADLERRLEESIAELNALREQIANDTIPQSRQLNELESELGDVRQEFQQASRLLDTRTLDLSNLRTEIKRREEESTYLSNLLTEYLQKFESRLHIAERQLPLVGDVVVDGLRHFDFIHHLLGVELNGGQRLHLEVLLSGIVGSS